MENPNSASQQRANARLFNYRNWFNTNFSGNIFPDILLFISFIRMIYIR